MPPSPVDTDVLEWAVRTSDPDFADWDGFLAWLAGDPSRQDAYDAVMIAVAQAEEALAAAPIAHATVVPIAARRTWRGRIAAIGGLALAAGVAGVMLLGRPADAPAALRVIATPPGRSTTIALAGGSRLRLDPRTPREAVLDRGRAIFVVRHDAGAPFGVTAGGHRIVDAGTTFEVALARGSTAVAVVAGRVIVDPARLRLNLVPGDAAELRDGRAPEVARVPATAIGQWRNARMSYRDVPLARVAADLSAALGQPIVLDDASKRRSFSGTLVPATLRDRPRDLAAVLDVRVTVGAQGWELRAR